MKPVDPPEPAPEDPCPCGSEAKYRQCCLPVIARRRERERITAGALEKAFACIERHAGDRLEGALEEGFLGGLNESERALLQSLGSDSRRQLEVNATEWLLAEGWVEEDGEALFFRSLLFPGSPMGEVPELEPAERAWLEAMVTAPLRVVRAEAVEAGEGLWVSEVFDPCAEPRWLDEPSLSLDVEAGTVFAARLFFGDPTRATGAFYALPAPALEEVRRHLDVAHQIVNEELDALDDDPSRGMLDEPVPGGEPGEEWPPPDFFSTAAGEAPSEVIVTTWLRDQIARAARGEHGPGAGERLSTRAAQCLYRELYEDFADSTLPELEGMTPRQAVLTEPGRRKVVAILEEQERSEREQAAEQGREPADLAFVWQQLGLGRDDR